MYLVKQFGNRFVVMVLGNEFAADGEVENGLAELFDLVRASGEAWEVADEELGVAAQGYGIRSIVQMMMG